MPVNTGTSEYLAENRTFTLISLMTGLIISGSIEVLQYFLKRGFSEFDDVFHNTLGCLVGLMIIMLMERIWLLLKRY